MRNDECFLLPKKTLVITHLSIAIANTLCYLLHVFRIAIEKATYYKSLEGAIEPAFILDFKRPSDA